MTYRGRITFITTTIIAIFLFIFFGFYIGFQNAYSIISSFSTFIPFIIVGIIMLIFGMNEKKWGSFLFTLVTLILLWISYKK